MAKSAINERIKCFIKHKGITIQKFETLCGLSNGYVNSIKKTLGADKLESIIRAFPDLNRGWLLTGEGPMTDSETSDKYNVGMGTLNQSGGSNEFKIEVERELINEAGDSNQVKRLKILLAKANQEISHLQGRVDEQEKFIKMLMEKK